MTRVGPPTDTKTIQATCPHCLTKNVAFAIYEAKYWEAKTVGQSTSYRWDTFAICGLCERGVIAIFKSWSRRNISYENSLETFLKTDPTFIGIAPQPPALRAPPHTPDNIARFVEQAKDNLSKNWDAAGTMFRKALDTALKRKFPDITGTLHERIKKAAETHALTPDLAEWADQIRLDGNNAAHEERPFRREEAERLAVFTELILQYLFTLPGMLKKAQEKRAIIIQRI